MMRPSAAAKRAHPGIWGWARLVLLSTLVVVGLLGMHTLSADHTDHAETPAAHVAAMGAHDRVADEAQAATTFAAGLDEIVSGAGHDAALIACVLALLVASLLIARARPGFIRSHRISVVALAVGLPATAPARPPSLLELSISRT